MVISALRGSRSPSGRRSASYEGHWKSISLATVYFSASPGLLGSLTLGEMARLVPLIENVAERSYELASACLDAAPNMFPLSKETARRS